jgi:hypothetical protein
MLLFVNAFHIQFIDVLTQYYYNYKSVSPKLMSYVYEYSIIYPKCRFGHNIA